jgi:hypothetical protein
MRNRTQVAGVLIVAWMTVASLPGCAARSSRVASTAECPESICPSLEALVRSDALHPGDNVRVVDTQRQRVTGTLLGLSATEISVRAHRQQVQLAEGDVLGIWRRESRGRSMARYAVVGAAGGLVWGGVAWLSKRDIDCTQERANLFNDCFVHESDYFVVPAAALAILGAGLGAFMRGELQLFAGVKRATAVRIRPHVDRHSKGVKVAIAF